MGRVRRNLLRIESCRLNCLAVRILKQNMFGTFCSTNHYYILETSERCVVHMVYLYGSFLQFCFGKL